MKCAKRQLVHKKYWGSVLVLPVFFVLAVLPHSAHAEYINGDPQSPEYRPGEVLVRYKPNSHPHGQFAQAYVAASAIDPADKALWKVDIGDSLTVPEAVAQFQKDPTVESAEPNIVRRASVIPNDPDYTTQWHLHADAGVDGPAAWDLQTGSHDVVVAVIDSGVDIDHPDLVNNIWTNPGEIPNNGQDDDHNGYVDDVHGYDFVDDDANPNPAPDGIDNDGVDGVDSGVTHGTHVAGIIAAEGNNGIGGSGVAWHTSILPVRVLDDEGSGTDELIAQGIIYAADMGVDIINMSLGGYGSTTVLQEAVAYAQSKGVLVVSAVGNDGINVDNNGFYPACYSQVLGVAATDSSDHPTWFSNFGSGCTDVAAPGDAMYSTLYTGDPAHGFTDDYGVMSGTSMATPVVSGVAALVKASNPDFTATQLFDVVTQNAEDVGMSRDYGLGRVDALLALQGVSILNRPTGVTGVVAYADSTLRDAYAPGSRHANTQPYFAWTAATDDTGIAGYDVYFGTDSSADPAEEGVFQTDRTYTPSAITGDAVPYFLRVQAKDLDGNLSRDIASFEYVIDTQMAVPTGVTLHSGNTGVIVRWHHVTGQHIRKYRVFRRDVLSSGAYQLIGSVGATKIAFTDRHVKPGQGYDYIVRAVDDLGNTAESDAASAVFTPREQLVVGAGVEGSPLVRIYDPKTQQYIRSWYADALTSRNGIEVAVGNVNADKHDEVVVGLGAGGLPLVKVFDAKGKELSSFLAYDQSFRGGVRVAVGDVNNDGVDEIITAPGSGMDAVIKIFTLAGAQVEKSFTAFDGNFRGGAYVSAFHWDGLRGEEIAVTPGSGGAPQVQVYNPLTGKVITSFFAYDQSFRGGVRTAAFHVDGATTDELATVPLTGFAVIHQFARNTSGQAEQVGSFAANLFNGGVVTAGHLGPSLTDVIAVGNADAQNSMVSVYAQNGGKSLDQLNPFGAFVGPVTIASGWVY